MSELLNHLTSLSTLTPEQQLAYGNLALAKVMAGKGGNLPKLEADYKRWLCTIAPKHFRNPDAELQFALHHRKFFDWGWNWKTGDTPACLWIVNRGGAKSTSAAGLVVGRAARKLSSYWLVITRTEKQGETHIRRVNSMLLGSNIGQYYPGMARPEVKEVGNRKIQGEWNRMMLTTEDGLILQSFSLLAALRGVGYEEFRPHGIWITDIDDEKDSLGMVETLADALSSSVLATMASDCMIVFDQNLIHRGSVLNKILTRQKDMLSDRVTVGPVPALHDPTYERKNEHWYVTSGRPSWPGGMPVEECESKLNSWGMQTWQREAQHNINLPYRDAVYKMWSEPHHLITWSEFAAGCIRLGYPRDWLFDRDGIPQLPQRGHIHMAEDWGNNSGHPCANRWVWTPPEEMPRLRRFKFFYREMCWPRFPLVENDDREHPSVIQVGKAILAAEKKWNEGGRVKLRLASHERPEIIRSYLVDMPEAGLPAMRFASILTARARDGILRQQDYLTLEPDKPHPFRFYPSGHLLEGQPLQGCPSEFFIVADGQGELYWDSESSTLMVTPPTDEHGQARTRFEYPNYRKPDASDGAEKKDPPKIDDDVIDCDRAIAGMTFASMQKLTDEMVVQSKLPTKLKPDYIAALPQASRNAAEYCATMARAEAMHEIKQAKVPTGYRPLSRRFNRRIL